MKKQIITLSATACILGAGLTTQALAGAHSGLKFADYPNNCLGCHQRQFTDMHTSTHYQWIGAAPDMANQPNSQQGKLTNAVNSYCINILGDWKLCGKCHAGRGLRPDDPAAGLTNIDCLVCHSEEYALKRDRMPDGTMGVATPTDTMVQNVHKPKRSNCLKCHAFAGGADGVKRGDLANALATNTDKNIDVHMHVGGANLSCQSCHVFNNHKVIGKGSDLRVTDDLSRGAAVNCGTCHSKMATTTLSENGHPSSIKPHLARVACQTCHIPTYAKFPTETHRDWRYHHDGSPADGVSGPGHPYTVKTQNLIPEYRWWNRKSNNALLHDNAELTFDPVTGTYPTSRPQGSVNDNASKLYPFKYKTALQPMRTTSKELIALDTLEYLGKSGNVQTAIANGLRNMGYSATDTYTWVTTDTYQLLNHGVNDEDRVAKCSDCHQNPGRMNFTNRASAGDYLGYALKTDKRTICGKCHRDRSLPSFADLHKKHVTDKKYDCSWCHTFSRPERGLRKP